MRNGEVLRSLHIGTLGLFSPYRRAQFIRAFNTFDVATACMAIRMHAAAAAAAHQSRDGARRLMSSTYTALIHTEPVTLVPCIPPTRRRAASYVTDKPNV